MNQLGALGRHAFIVYIERAPGVFQCAIVDRADLGMGDLLTHLIVKHRGLLGHRGGFQQMAAGFMKDHAAKAIAHHHRHGAAGTGPGGEIDQSLACCLSAECRGVMLIGHFPTEQAAKVIATNRLIAAIAGNGGQRGAHIVPGIVRVQSFAVKDFHRLFALQASALGLMNRRATGKGGAAGRQQIGYLGVQLGVLGQPFLGRVLVV